MRQLAVEHLNIPAHVEDPSAVLASIPHRGNPSPRCVVFRTGLRVLKLLVEAADGKQRRIPSPVTPLNPADPRLRQPLHSRLQPRPAAAGGPSQYSPASVGRRHSRRGTGIEIDPRLSPGRPLQSGVEIVVL